jgi:aryl-alcohol dehydrogenase-like predicted oxidoreductase
MNYEKFGNTDLIVSKIGFGAWGSEDLLWLVLFHRMGNVDDKFQFPH